MSENMKPSGVNYLGVIPSSWNAKRMKYCADICNGAEYADIVIDEGGFPVMGSGGEFARASKFCYSNQSVLLGRKGTIDKPLFIDEPFWCVDTMFYTKMKREINAKFLYYCSLNIRFDFYVTSTALPSMTQRDLGSEKIAVPSFIEQTLIANFLDEQCGKIDSVATDIEKQIEVLQKYKKSLITETVTKGLDKSVPMVDGGVDFGNQISSEFTKTKIKYLCNMFSGDNLTSDEIEDDESYLVYGGNGTRGYYSKFNVEGKHVLIGRQGALCGNIHLASGKFWATDHAIVVYHNNNSIVEYLYFLFEAMNLNKHSQTAAQPGLAVNMILDLKTCIPNTKDEQIQIANYLDQQCSKIDSIIESKKEQLAKITQHKKSLIYEYVTGKKRVKGAKDNGN